MAIIGAVLGDIAGSQYEFYKPPGLNPDTCKLFTESCEFTDDTVMTLAAKSAILNHETFADSYRKFGEQYPDKGYGLNFESWLKNKNMKAYNSIGNGSAMRCSYIGEYFDNQKDVIEWATKSAECTHNHPEGIKGAVVTAMCVYMARIGATKSDVFDYAARQYPKSDYPYPIEFSIAEYRENYQWNEVCHWSVPVAIRCFLESEDYESFLRNVFSLRCDMDTICAIGGGIAEEFYKGTGLDEDMLLRKYLDNNLYKIVKRKGNMNMSKNNITTEALVVDNVIDYEYMKKHPVKVNTDFLVSELALIKDCSGEIL